MLRVGKRAAADGAGRARRLTDGGLAGSSLGGTGEDPVWALCHLSHSPVRELLVLEAEPFGKVGLQTRCMRLSEGGARDAREQP